jgi:hypothetical protein
MKLAAWMRLLAWAVSNSELGSGALVAEQSMAAAMGNEKHGRGSGGLTA